MQLLETPYLLTVAEYMSLDTQERTELLEGIIYYVSPRKEPHCYAVRELNRVLSYALFGPTYIVQTENAVAVSGWQGKNAPEIDVAVLKKQYYEPIPTASDAFAFIEVSDTTYRVDRDFKIPLYVSAGVPSWIVNISLHQVEFYGSAEDLELEHGHIFTERNTFDILGVLIPVATLFPKAN